MRTLFLAAFALAACNSPKIASDVKVWMKIDPNQCANAWDSDGSNSPEGYLAAHKIKIISEVSVRNPKVGEVVCAACDCPSRNTIYFQVSRSDADQLAKMGFVPGEPPPQTSAKP